MAVLKGFVLETCGSLGQEVRTIKEELVTKGELHTLKEELHKTKEELHKIKDELNKTTKELHRIEEEPHKEELYAINEELDAIKDELQVSDEAYGLSEDEVERMLDQAKIDIKEELVEELTRGQEYYIDQSVEELDFYTTGEMDGQLTEMQKQLTDLQENYLDLDQAIGELDVYTKGEVEERLDQVERHCEGINNLETEELVLDAKSGLEKDIIHEIEVAKLDLQKWSKGVMKQMVQRKRYSRHGPASIWRKIRHQRKTASKGVGKQSPPHMSDVSSTASAASASRGLPRAACQSDEN